MVEAARKKNEGDLRMRILDDCSIIPRGEATVGGNHHLVPFLAAAKEPRGVVGDLFLLTSPRLIS